LQSEGSRRVQRKVFLRITPFVKRNIEKPGSFVQRELTPERHHRFMGGINRVLKAASGRECRERFRPA